MCTLNAILGNQMKTFLVSSQLTDLTNVEFLNVLIQFGQKDESFMLKDLLDKIIL